MIRQLSSKHLAVLALLLVLGSCVKKVQLSTPQAAQLTISQSLGILAGTLKGTAAAAQELNRQKVLPDGITRSIMGYVALVSPTARAGVAINSSGLTPDQKAAEIKRIMAELPKLTLPPDISKFINSPQGVQLQALISLITSAGQIVSGLIGAPTK